MRITDSRGGDLRANNDTIAVANTAQLVAAGAETTTFASQVRYIIVTYASGACWIAKNATEAAATAGGAIDDRIYIPSGATGLVFPWSGTDVAFLNATAGETPSIYLAAWY